MNAYFICVIVYVQMWCMCAQPYVDQIKKFFVLFVCFWRWFVSPMFFKKISNCFEWKTCFLGVFASKAYPQKISQVKLSHDVWTETFTTVSQVRLTCEKFRESISRENFQISFLKGIPWDICFKHLPSSPKPLF